MSHPEIELPGLCLPLAQKRPCCTKLHQGLDLHRVQRAFEASGLAALTGGQDDNDNEDDDENAMSRRKRGSGSGSSRKPAMTAPDCAQLGLCVALARTILVQWGAVANRRALIVMRRGGLAPAVVNAILLRIGAHNRTTAAVCVAAVHEELLLLLQATSTTTTKEDDAARSTLVFFQEQPELRLCVEAHRVIARTLGALYAHVGHRHSMCACGGCGFLLLVS